MDISKHNERLGRESGLKIFHLYLKEKQLEQLKKLSEKTGAPAAEMIRRALDEYLKKQK